MSGLADHLVILPIILPLVVAAAMLLFDERRRKLKAGLSLLTVAGILAASVALLYDAATGPAGVGAFQVYALGNWAAPFGIVLVADQLSALMLVLSSTLGVGALLFALARWDGAGPRFHALFLLLLMGVNGAVLTGDLFNLFVFVELMLAASYGLVLHGSGEERVRAGLHYIAINLGASMLFLIGVSLIYGTAGTLNMADLADRIPNLSDKVRPLFELGCAILAMAFLIKASTWPLGFWLPRTYAAASAPVAALLAIMSKVGVYALVRLSLLLFGPTAGASAGFGGDWLLAAGLATIAFGTVGALGARELTQAVGFSIMISSGTVLAALGLGDERALAGALFYMAGSTLAAGALYLLAEILARDDREDAEDSSEQVFADEYQDPFDQETREDAIAIPLTVAVLGGAFLACTLTLAGLPPLAGFIGKLAIFIGALSPGGDAAGWAGWSTVALLTLSSLGVLICLARFGVAELWVPAEEPSPMVRPVEFAALAGLIGAVLLLTILGGRVMDFMDQTVAGLERPGEYVSAVLGAEIR